MDNQIACLAAAGEIDLAEWQAEVGPILIDPIAVDAGVDQLMQLIPLLDKQD